jgi:hypothetical protein
MLAKEANATSEAGATDSKIEQAPPPPPMDNEIMVKRESSYPMSMKFANSFLELFKPPDEVEISYVRKFSNIPAFLNKNFDELRKDLGTPKEDSIGLYTNFGSVLLGIMGEYDALDCRAKIKYLGEHKPELMTFPPWYLDRLKNGAQLLMQVAEELAELPQNKMLAKKEKKKK